MNEFFVVLLSILMLIVIARFFVLSSIRLLSKYYQLKKHGVLCKAKIVGYRKEKDNDGSIFYFPLIQFFTKEGQVIEGKLSVGKPKEDLRNKEEVLIYSDPEEPENFIEKSRQPLIFGWTSVIMSILACFLIIGYMYTNLKNYFT